jgi:hypothetical protein
MIPSRLEVSSMLLALMLLLALQAAPAADPLTGAWEVKSDVQGNTFSETCNFAQSGTTLTGSCVSDDETIPLIGRVEAGKIIFWHGGDWDGQALTVVYSGTLASATEMKGTIEIRPMKMAGTFTAAPVSAPATPASVKP